MRLLVQRVKEAKVVFENDSFNEISNGLLVYLGVHKNDLEKDIDKSIDKLLKLRIFENELGKLDKSVLDLNYEIMIISNFSLYASLKKGNRPSFTETANARFAEEMYEKFIGKLIEKNVNFKSGIFQSNMKIYSVNDGPLNLILDTKEGE